jgi:hypothetical protein
MLASRGTGVYSFVARDGISLTYHTTGASNTTCGYFSCRCGGYYAPAASLEWHIQNASVICQHIKEVNRDIFQNSFPAIAE